MVYLLVACRTEESIREETETTFSNLESKQGDESLFEEINEVSTKEGYDVIIDSLESEQWYAYITLDTIEEPILIVSDLTYEYEADVQASIFVSVYYNFEGDTKFIGEVRTAGTAYPLRFDQTSIYAAGGHFVTRYTIDIQEEKLVEIEKAEIKYAVGTGSETYFYFNNAEGEEKLENDIMFTTMNDSYGDASVIKFNKLDSLETAENVHN